MSQLHWILNLISLLCDSPPVPTAQIGNSHHSLRTMSVLLAPHLPESTVHYFIDELGVHGINTNECLETLPPTNGLG